jgi:ribosomal protein L11 methyltransferase
MDWLRLVVEVEASGVDAVVEFLERFGAVSASVERAGGQALLAEADEPHGYWDLNRVSALLPADVEQDILVACLRNAAGPHALRAVRWEPVGDRDWVAAARQSARPLLFGGRLCVCPRWVEPLPAEHVLRLDPGLAFGTGTHATTALCLEELVGQDPAGRTVIDYGCGSGILALAAALLGARSVIAVDVDPQALAATQENAERNDLRDRVIVQDPSRPLPQCDLLVANILLRPLMELAPRFADAVVPGGRVLLSGILAIQASECLAHYERWFTMTAPRFRDEWALLQGERKAA